MRSQAVCMSLIAVAFGLVCAATAVAQSSEPVCTPGVSTALGIAHSNKKETPYIATVRTSFEQRLPDGSYIRGSSLTHEARDSAGRTMQEAMIGCKRDGKGGVEPHLSVSVDDPTTRTLLSWQTGVGTTTIATQQKKPSPSLTPAIAAARLKISPTMRETKVEDLGTRTVAGIEARGSRQTRTIPPGEEGNELPLIVTNETWASRDLGVTLVQIIDDPRHGRSTFQVEELSRTEPDAAVFAPPAGYKIEARALPSVTVAAP